MLKKWQQRFVAVATALGYTEKVKDGKLTADEQKQIFAKYKEDYGIAFGKDKEANEDAEVLEEQDELSAEEMTGIINLLGVDSKDINKNPVKVVREAARKVETINKEAEQLRTQNAVLKNEEEEQKPREVKVGNGMIGFIGAKHSETHLFGVENDLYLISRPENQIMLTGEPFFAKFKSKERLAFQERVETFAETVNERIGYLRKNNLFGALNFDSMIKGESSIDYSELMDSAGEYIVRRSDLILAYLRKIPTVRNTIFPVLSGVQNKMKAPTASFSEISQGYRKGRIFKGNVKFGDETYKVDDVMFKYNFEDMIDLEKQYIGYMNREGSSVIKWTFMEWILVHFGTRLINEQNIRNVRGFAVPEQSVTANPANFAADGGLRAIQRAEDEFKILPFNAFGVYDSTSMLDVYEGMWDKVCELVDDVDMFKIYGNAKHKRWYIRAYRNKYGDDADFSGSQAQLVDLAPDKIVWVPNMPINSYKVWITVPGNVELQEDKANEMLEFEFTKEYEGVLGLSRWKEGSKVIQPGIAFKTKAELEANNYEEQWIFTNKPTVDLALEDVIDLKDNDHFLISGNTAVTTANGVKADIVYKLEAAAVGAKVTKSGAFEKIGSDFTAVAVGDYIYVYAELEDYTTQVDGESVTRTRMTGKLLELNRFVTVAG